jgi:hypothetical protein
MLSLMIISIMIDFSLLSSLSDMVHDAFGWNSGVLSLICFDTKYKEHFPWQKSKRKKKGKRKRETRIAACYI